MEIRSNKKKMACVNIAKGKWPHFRRYTNNLQDKNIF